MSDITAAGHAWSDEIPQVEVFPVDSETPMPAPIDVAGLDRREKAANIIRFSGLRYAANIEWLGGIIIGNAVRVETGASGWLIGGAVGITIGFLEYPQTIYGAKNFDTDAVLSNSYSMKSEALATGSAIWQGAGATTKVNTSLGLANSKKRRAIQSLAYGLGVGAWSTPLPVYRQGADAAQKAVEYISENPVGSTVTALVGSSIVYGALESIKRIRTRRKSQNPVV